MIKTDFNIDETYFTKFFRDSQESLLIIDQNKKIVFMNKKAASLFGNLSSISETEHFFTFFDICILDNKNNHTPLKEAFLANESLKAEILFQAGDNEYKNFYLKSFKNNGNTVIILSDLSAQIKIVENEKQLKKNKEKIIKLEKDNKKFLQVKEQAQNLAIRTGLVNRISNSIKDSLDVEKIIKTALTEISLTLGLNKSYFACFDENTFIIKITWNPDETEKEKLEKIYPDNDLGIKQAFNEHKSVVSMIMTNQDTNHIQPRLVTPVVYSGKILGIMVFFHTNNKRLWNEEEISLIEGITSQLASAINQAELFETVIKQKNEIQDTLVKLKETQAQLVQSEKMASLGQLVAGVAHEINTPLGAVNSNNSIFLKCIEKINAEIEKNSVLDSIVEIFKETIKTNFEAIKRINNLVKSLKNFARLDEAEYQEIDIH
ncbi:MAG: GAF domain-containing protein, partial [Candidatus Aenigmarchaeota archaeon]|nr:GAF domain-containing protein [Candidatus Aenigmarchaeota archaeon]